MKINRKTVLSTSAVLGVAALIAGGTIAYFTDKDSETNTFTVGNVDIQLYESQLHRQNSGRTGTFTALASDDDYCDYTIVQPGVNYNNNPMNTYESARYCTPGMDANNTTGISAVINGHTRTGFSNANRNWGYSDSTIVSDSEDYKAGATTETTADDGYFTRTANNIVPGQWVRKFSYVENKDASSDVYVLIRYMVPTSYAANVELKVPGTPYEEDTDNTRDGVQGYFTAVTKDAATDKYVAFDSSTADAMDSYTGYTETIDNVEYKVYAAITTQALKPGEMTYWSPINTVRLTTSTQLTDATLPANKQIDVKVDAQAIQAKTFGNGVEAFNALLSQQ